MSWQILMLPLERGMILRPLFNFIIVLSIISCASVPKEGGSSNKAKEIKLEHFKTSKIMDVGKKAADFAKLFHPKNVLVVFDADNTLLTMRSDLGSDQWFSWQEDLFFDALDNKSQPELVALTFQSLLNAQGILFQLGDMTAVEGGLSRKVFQMIRKAGHPMLILTSRGHDFRHDTIMELQNNGYYFKDSAPEFLVTHEGAMMPYNPDTVDEDFGFTSEEIKEFRLKHPRKVAYLDGIFLTAGQHKGAMLRIWLKKTGLSPKAIIFVDDKEKHTKRMTAAYKSSGIHLATFHYTKLDPRVKAMNKKKMANQWNRLQAAYKSGNTNSIRKTIQKIFGK